MRRRCLGYFLLLMILVVFLFALAVLLSDDIPILQAMYLHAPEAYILFSALMALCAGFLAALPLSSLIARPPQNLNGQYNYDTLPSLLDELSYRRRQDRSRATALEKHEKDLRLIMDNMSEGLVIMNGDGVIISMNKGAEALILTTCQPYVGKHLFAICRNSALQAAVHMAIGGTTDEAHFQLQGKHIHAIANPVFTGGGSGGIVLFLLDTTREYVAEQMRREFSANVSHELKTPLTSISGYAELMKNGIVAPQDVPRFAGNIYREAQHLIALVNDIIRLSRLDEDADVGEFAPVDLLALAQTVVFRLQQKAATLQVALTVTGVPITVQGDMSILEEMLFNLCDNAITYNRPGGRAEVFLRQEKKGPSITVWDNGIGIPLEHQSRVFERFYRVDKSHSRATGGTGLGLSIVKHGAQFHRAEIQLTSTPDKGTTIHLQFQAENP